MDIPDDERVKLQISFWRHWKRRIDRRRAANLMSYTDKAAFIDEDCTVVKLEYNFNELMPQLYTPAA